MKTASGLERPINGSIEERAKFYGYDPNNIITGTVLTMNDGLRRDKPVTAKTQIIIRKKKSGAL